MKEINLEEILRSVNNQCHYVDQAYIDEYEYDGHLDIILEAMKEACNQAIDLCADNADVKEAHSMSICEECGGQIIDEYSILKTKDQIK